MQSECDNNNLHESVDVTDIVILYSTWLRGVAKKLYVRYYSSGVELGDFIQYGSIGLIESAKNFKKNESVRFTSFAYLRVKGTILNHIYKFSEVGNYLCSQYRRERDRLNSIRNNNSLEDIDRYSNLVINLAFSILIEERAEDIFTDQDVNYASYQSEENLKIVHELIFLLSEEKQKVMILHYFQFIPFTDIASLMGISKARVSQIHASALADMKEKLEHQGQYEF
ncbi:sigma-70 family RNA polymerase sigma factor [Vibrio cincinnatiensis]|uniref:sigma-70 family RNA polymerase sigma factor n=1 Tax=Vibrio cincinnatiensis TaxID=675 RepID=UPI001EE0CAEE|nr:sigma-70 family RNA polymerase sigma factor [Vibrio cincinnatiensis]MCG3723708.1 sigma-70 family RNA polymerase sigma factor [Vibrio cincinnatiensis]